MKATFEAVPDDVDALKAALIAERDRAAGVEAELAVAKAKASDNQAVIAHQQLQIAKLTGQTSVHRPDRTPPPPEKKKLALEQLETKATQDRVRYETPLAQK